MDTDERVGAIQEDFEDIFEWSTDHPDHSEPELSDAITDTDLLQNLGYEELGTDYRIDKSTDDSSKRPDIRCISKTTGEVVFVIELKRSERIEPLSSHRGQLENRYVVPLRADYGILMNGHELILYERVSRDSCERVFGSRLNNLSESELRTIATNLKNPGESFTQTPAVHDYFGKYANTSERLYLTEPESRSNFYDDFSLQESSSFKSLVKQTIRLFDEMQEDSDFTASAYDFWEQSYARDTSRSEAPDWWKEIIQETSLSWSNLGIRKFMFCLETSYALFSRLVLGKACADYNVPGIDFGESILEEIEETSRNNDIPLNGWPLVTQHLIEDMRRNLIEGVFEEDIFYWWTDYLPILKEDLNRLWSTSGQIGEINRKLTTFGEALRDVILSLYKYDFERLAQEPGDPLGDLYQNYFDRKTRKALGEFYTPQLVVEYMLDSLGYEGEGIGDSRLIDPACGSGTFIVAALERYLKGNARRAEHEGWGPIIEELCNEFKIVGFDIHPFAVLMSQVQFMLVLIPKYKQAMEEPGEFSPSRLPIFGTDSLEQIGQTTLTQSQDTIPVEMRLPVENDEGENVEITVNFPHYRRVLSTQEIDVYNEEDYFVALQAVFAAVKEQVALAEEGLAEYRIDEGDLADELRNHLDGDRDYRQMAEFFASEMAEELILTIERLINQYNDGRLVKSIEDDVIATLLKNPDYVEFDYVIANPPYVDNQELNSKQKERIEETFYNTTQDVGNWDLYCPFMEKGVQWLAEDGRFSYITPDQYMRTKYGRGVRGVILDNTKIEEIVDFRNADVFQDVLNYPAITTLERASEEERLENTFDFVRVADADENGDDDGKGRIGSDVIQRIRDHVGDEDYSDEYIDAYHYDQTDLSRDFWSIMPADEQEVFDHMRSVGTVDIDDVSSEGGSFQGLRTGLNEIFIVTLPHRDIVHADDAGGIVEAQPTGSDYPGIYEIETDLLRPFLKGKEVGRWQLKEWSGQHIIVPYNITEYDDGTVDYRLYTEDEMENQFENTLEYLEQWKSLDDDRRDLEGRDGGEWKGRDDWYAWARNQNIEKFERQKLMNVETSAYPQFMSDAEGQWYTTSAYGLILSDQYQDYTPYITALLNSSLLDYYLKHVSVLKDGDHYKYVSQYLERLPLVIPDEDNSYLHEINQAVEDIEYIIDYDTKIEGFPGRYLEEYRARGEPVDRKTLVSDAGHSDMDPSITKVNENTYHVVIGARKKEDPIVVNSEKKAEYVRQALLGDDVDQDEQIEILVPRSDAGVEELLSNWQDDKERRDGLNNIEDIEETIDEAVFNHYFEGGLDPEQQEVVNRFLDRF